MRNLLGEFLTVVGGLPAELFFTEFEKSPKVVGEIGWPNFPGSDFSQIFRSRTAFSKWLGPRVPGVSVFGDMSHDFSPL